MALVSGIIAYNNLNEYTLISRNIAKKFNITLPTDRTYEIGIDQSTSCTGVYIQDLKDEINILLEIEFANPSKKSYFMELFSLLRRIITQVNVSLLVCEKPIPKDSQSYTYRVLTELFGRLESFLEMEPSLENTDLKSIYPMSWKSKIVDKSKGTGRINNKVCIAEDICDKKPILRNYLLVSPAKDLDGFDACGILLGYKKCAFTENGMPKIYGEIEKRHTTYVYYRYVDMSNIENTQQLKDVLYGCFGETVTYYQPQFKIFNSEYNLLRNIKMASSTYKMTVTSIPNKLLEPLRWEFGFDYDKNKTMFAYIVKDKEFSKRDITVLNTIFPWYLKYGAVS